MMNTRLLAIEVSRMENLGIWVACLAPPLGGDKLSRKCYTGLASESECIFGVLIGLLLVWGVLKTLSIT